MKRYISSFLLLFCFVVSVGFAQKPYDELTYPSLPTYKLPKVDQFKLRNGVKVYMLPDHELPLVNVHVIVRGGSFEDPANKSGMADLMASVMRDGGSKKYPADTLNKILEDKAARLNIGMDFASGSANLNVLREDLPGLLPVFVDVLKNPAFPDDKIALDKKQAKTVISRRNDNVQGIAGREFNRLIYGPNSVYGRLEEYQTINDITRADLQSLHDKAYVGQNLMVGVVGDFDTRSMKKMIQSAFGSFKKGSGTALDLPKVNYRYKPTINLIDKPDVNQSVVYLGHIGGFRKNPDYAALQVMNEILSGGFSGRLMKHVRTDLGLAYAVYGRYTSNVLYPGVFYTGVMTKSSTTAQAIDAIINEIKKLQQDGVTDKELQDTRDQFLNSLVFHYDSRSKILNEKMRNAYLGLPPDEFERYVENVKKVTTADVQRVAKKYLKPSDLQILVVGNASEIGDQLNKFGNVNKIDITIPEPKSAGQESSVKGDSSKGRHWLDKMAGALIKTGTELKKITTKGEVTQYNPQLPNGKISMHATTTIVFPDRLRTEITTPGGTMVMTLADGKAARSMGGQTQPLPSQVAELLEEGIHRNYLNLALNKDSLKTAYLGTVNMDGKKLVKLKIEASKPFTLLIDSDTGLPQYLRYSQFVPSEGNVDVQMSYMDWKSENGVNFAMKQVTTQNGKKASEVVYDSFSVN